MTNVSRQSRLDQARAQTDHLFNCIHPAFLYARPVAERHRLIFYLGHLETFDWNHLAVRALGEPRFHPAFDELFEAGIDPAPGQLPSDKPEDWPSELAVRSYAKLLRERIDARVAQAPDDVFEMVLEHRLMHAETLAYLLHNFPYEAKLKPSRSESPVATRERSRTPVEVPAGSATLGKNRSEGFGWDNEFEAHAVTVPAFVIDRYKVTNGEYLEFVEQGAEPPHFWHRSGDRWHLRGMWDCPPLPLDWPVFVTHEQATAYALWRGKKLPSEAQYHRAAFGNLRGPERSYPWGEEHPTAQHGNFCFFAWDPVPVSANLKGDSAWGVSQLLGNGWEWTSTVFAPLPGFTPTPGYEGYSANFFDGEHFVMKGASSRTAACFLRRSFRNWFRPNYPYVYAGFRCIEE